METRQIEEVKVWGLILNPLKENTENGNVVALAYEKQKLIDWYNSLLAPEPYEDKGEVNFPSKGDFGGYSNPNHTFYKVFIKGSELEWFNPCDMDVLNDFGHGLNFQWMQEKDINPSIKFIH